MSASCSRGVAAQRVAALVPSKRVEDVLSAVILLERVLAMPSCDQCCGLTESAVLANAQKHVSADLVIQMIQSKDKPTFRSAGLSFMCRSCLIPELRRVWLPKIESIVNAAMDSPDSTERSQLLSSVSLLCSGDISEAATFRDRAVVAFLSHHATCASPFPIESLAFVCDLLSVPHTSSLRLPDGAALQLQSLVTQCLHGLAQECVRDECLEACLVLLHPTGTLHPSWACVLPASPRSSDLQSSFPCLMCSVVSGELKLCVEEAIYFHRILTNKFPDVTTERPDQAHCRFQRANRALSTCAQLVLNLLAVLVAEDEPWEGLTATATLAIRNHVAACQNSIVELLADSGTANSLENATETSVTTEDRAYMHKALHACAQAAVALAREDVDLRRILLDKLVAILLLSPYSNPEEGSTGSLGCKEIFVEVFQLLWSLAEEADLDQEPGIEWHQSEVLDAMLPATRGVLRTCAGCARALDGEAEVQAETCYYGLRYLSALLGLLDKPIKALLRTEGEAAFEELLHCGAGDLRDLFKALQCVCPERPDLHGMAYKVRLQVESFTVLGLLDEA